MKAKLVVVGGEAKAAEINLKLPTIIGRGNEAPLTLRHPLVSRQHCELFESNGQLIVRDLGSLNGTFINNERITEAVLPNGELLTVGTVTFRAVYDDAPSKSAAKVPPRQQKTARNEKTVGPPSAPTVEVGAPKASLSASTQAQPAPKALAAKAMPAPSDTSELTTAPAPRADSPSRSGKSIPVAKAPAPPIKPPAKETPPPPKKKWAESADRVEFQESEEDFELGEDESLPEPNAMPPVGEFTMQVHKSGAPVRAKPDDDDGFDVQDLDFDTPSSANLLASNPAASGPSESAVGDLTANFDPKKLAADEKARKLAKEKEATKAKEPVKAPPAKAPAAKAPAAKTPEVKPPPAKSPEIKSPPAKTPAAKTPVIIVPPVKEQDSEKTQGSPVAAPKESTKQEDEDLEEFFKSLGVN